MVVPPVTHRPYKAITSAKDPVRFFYEGVLSNAASLADFIQYAQIYTPDNELLMHTLDYFLFWYSVPAWEVMSLLLRPDTTARNVIETIHVSLRNITILGRYIIKGNYRECSGDGSEIQKLENEYIANKKVLDTLWRIWAYCIVSIEGFIEGKCIVYQVNWLRGPYILARDWLQLQKSLPCSWSYRPCGFHNLALRDDGNNTTTSSDLLTYWKRLVDEWTRKLPVIDDKKSRELSEQLLMYILSRTTGPGDLIELFKNRSEYNHLNFSRGVTMVLTQPKDT